MNTQHPKVEEKLWRPSDAYEFEYQSTEQQLEHPSELGRMARRRQPGLASWTETMGTWARLMGGAVVLALASLAWVFIRRPANGSRSFVRGRRWGAAVSAATGGHPEDINGM